MTPRSLPQGTSLANGTIRHLAPHLCTFRDKNCALFVIADKIQDLVSLYSSVSPLTLKRSIDRHLKAMPADHYSVPSQRFLVAAVG